MFVPTNDGTLNIFEITDQGSPQANRYQQVVPGAAFSVSIYQEHLKQVRGDYPRLTMLDCPIQIRDVSDPDGSWKRVLIGTTGLGVDLQNKLEEGWTEEIGQKPNDSAGDLDSGHHFAIYAIDVSDPDDPEQLWTRENLHWSGSQSSNPADLDMERCVSRPVIGYTLTDSDAADTSDNRTWHSLFVGLDADDNLMWLDLDPLTGVIRENGVFSYEEPGKNKNSPSTTVEETTTAAIENVYPSRILAAYPKEAAEAGEGSPVLTDVYVQLSSGSVYFWNLQETPSEGEAVSSPRKLLTVTNSNGNNAEICPPLTNFDVAYYEGDTYLAMVVAYEPQGNGNSHDTPVLLVINLEEQFGDDFRSPDSGSDIEAQTIDLNSEGLGFDTIKPLGNDEIYVMQMDQQGSSKEGDFDILISDPVFLNGKLYLSAFSDTTDPEYTLLYHIPLSLFTDSQKTRIQKEKGDPPSESEIYTLIEASGAQMFVDASGTLFIVDDQGGVVYSADVMGNLGEMGVSGDIAPEDQMQVIYWREN